MNYQVRLGWFFVLIGAVGQAESACRSPYSDLCGYNGDEYNATKIEELDDYICNCPEVTFCSVIDLSEECKSATISLSLDGNITASSRLHCDVSALDSQTKTTAYEVSNRSEHEFTVKVSTESDFGRFKVVCDAFEIIDGFSPTGESPWGIVSVSPSEVTVHSQNQLQVTITGESEMNSTRTWCFVKTPDGNTEVLTTAWISDTQIECNGFSPAIPGVFVVSLNSYMSPDIFDTAISVKATSKHPTAYAAEYSPDFERIYIHFDENIELQSTCAGVFPEDTNKDFGIGFDCITKGNVLVVKMGKHIKIINEVTLTADSRICLAGCQVAGACSVAQPVRLAVSKPKVSGPSLSFYLNAACSGNSTEKYVSVKVTPGRFVPESQTAPPKNSGKGQRRNLMIWRTMRRFQSRLSSRRVVLELDSTDVHPAVESLTELDNALDGEDGFASTASVSVVVQSSAGISSVLAEANVGFCEGRSKSVRYEWVVNGRNILEDGRLLVLKDLAPGKYVIKCVVVGCDSGEVLGQGWTTTEVLPTAEKLLVIPREITAGKTDGVSLRVETWHGNSVSWSCRTKSDQPCHTRDKKLINDLIDLSSQNISIPGGSLPVGSYIWTVESSRGSTEAKVFIKDGNATPVGVELPSVFVNPSEEVVVQGIVGKVRSGCRAWWSSVRQKGFNYLPLKTVGVEIEAPVNFPSHVPLVIPPDWKNVDSDTQFLFQLQVFCPHGLNNQRGSFDYVKVPLVLINPPRVSSPIVSPLTGEAMVTEFSVSGTEADASIDDHPLTYEWSYVDPCDVEVPIRRGVFLRNFTTFLPPGDLKLMVRVCNGRKICATASSPTIDVVQGSDFPADNFRKIRTQIRYLTKSGDILEGFGLAITAFKSLAFLAEGGAREEILTTVEEAINDRMNNLAERMRSDPKNLNSCLEFFERAVTVAKYFRKGSDVLNRLTEFREGVLNGLNSGVD